MYSLVKEYFFEPLIGCFVMLGFMLSAMLIFFLIGVAFSLPFIVLDLLTML